MLTNVPRTTEGAIQVRFVSTQLAAISATVKPDTPGIIAAMVYIRAILVVVLETFILLS